MCFSSSPAPAAAAAPVQPTPPSIPAEQSSVPASNQAAPAPGYTTSAGSGNASTTRTATPTAPNNAGNTRYDRTSDTSLTGSSGLNM